MVENWFTRSLGSVALYRVSESLSLELDQETPRNLGGTRITIIDAPQIGGSEQARMRERDGDRHG